MWQIDGEKETCGTKGGLVSKRKQSKKLVVTTNGKKSAEVIVGVEKEKAWICANMRNGNWYCSGYFVLQTAFNNKKLRELGYPTFTEFYLKICEN